MQKKRGKSGGAKALQKGRSLRKERKAHRKKSLFQDGDIHLWSPWAANEKADAAPTLPSEGKRAELLLEPMEKGRE